MGVFNYVAVETACPYCGALCRGFQTKDGDPHMGTVSVGAVATFYTSCDGCGEWVEFSRHLPTLDPPTTQYLTLAEIKTMGFRVVSNG